MCWSQHFEKSYASCDGSLCLFSGWAWSSRTRRASGKGWTWCKSKIDSTVLYLNTTFRYFIPLYTSTPLLHLLNCFCFTFSAQGGSGPAGTPGEPGYPGSAVSSRLPAFIWNNLKYSIINYKTLSNSDETEGMWSILHTLHLQYNATYEQQ